VPLLDVKKKAFAGWKTVNVSKFNFFVKHIISCEKRFDEVVA